MPGKNRKSFTKSSLNRIPSALCHRIAVQAVFFARQYMRMRSWRYAEELYPVWGPNRVGIGIPRQLFYLNYQNEGTRPFIPWGLEGKIVPMAHGKRFRTAVGVGMPGWIHDWREGQYNHLIWRQQKWRNPGIKATWFINRAIGQALDRFSRELRKYPQGQKWLREGIKKQPRGAA